MSKTVYTSKIIVKISGQHLYAARPILPSNLCNWYRRYSIPFAVKYLSASSAAIQPLPAAVTAWR